jgi:NDP-sugar pyrophosphorylase family protein
MKAMVLAAGLGTRLRPLTDTRPKALMEVAGRTLLEITLTRLGEFGIDEVIVNVHHFAEQITEYLQSKNNFGMRIELSREDDLLLDTGGGLKNAAWFFLNGNQADRPFILHNVDVVSTVDLARMIGSHKEHNALATLALQSRTSSRYLLFDGNFELCGRRRAQQGDELVRAALPEHALAFTGIHVISPRLLGMIREEGAFSIIDVYLRLASEGEKIAAYRADDYYWRDLGRLQDLKQAEEDLKQGVLS